MLESIKNVMILGGGRIGYNTARELCEKKFNVTVLEKNKKKAFEIAKKHGDSSVVYKNLSIFIEDVMNS